MSLIRRALPPFPRSLFAVLPVVLASVICNPAQGQWSFEAFAGTAVSANSPLTIHQDGYPALKLDAQWDTRPFKPTIYYAVRIARWWGSTGVFLDNLHHKLYLANPTVEVRRFEVTYGYNLLAVGAAFRRGDWSLIAGAGPILTNPASVIRGRRLFHSGGFFGTGYHLDGVHLQTGVNRRLHVADAVFLSADLRLSAGWAEVDIANGKAEVPNYAVHFLCGLGIGNRRR
jgi:hypothetical protein